MSTTRVTRQRCVQLRLDVEEAAEKARALYGAGITPLGLLVAELGAVAQQAPLWLRLNIEACIATFEARTAPDTTDNHRPMQADCAVDSDR